MGPEYNIRLCFMSAQHVCRLWCYRLEWVSASESVKFTEVMRKAYEEIKALGPSPYRTW